MNLRLLLLAIVFAVGCQKQQEPIAVTPVESNHFAPFELEVGQEKESDSVEKVDVKKPKLAPKVEKKKRPVNRSSYKPSKLQIVANFDKADATVNGLPYPEYIGTEESEGMVLPAGGPYTIVVKQGTKSKTYRLHLRPYETRMLFVELSGLNESKPAPRKTPAKKETKKEEPKKKETKTDDKKGPGKVTVYAKPSGTIMADGKKLSDKTPGTIELENGRHEIQVEYEDGQISEKKIVRVRDGSKIKLFFRQRKK